MATSYSHPGGTGNRSPLILTHAVGASAQGATLVNGNLTDGGFFWFTSTTGCVIEFWFPSAQIIDEAICYQSSSTAQGTWQWQGSADRTTWTDIGGTFTLGVPATQTITTLAGNTTAYRFYRLLQVSGTTTSTPYLLEVEFKIEDGGSLTSYTHPRGSGNRTSLITSSVSGITWASGSAANLLDGAITEVAYWNAAANAGQWLAFDFGAAYVVQEARYYLSVLSTQGDWQLQGNPDASTWTDLGAPFTLLGEHWGVMALAPNYAAVTRITGFASNTTAYQHYRLLGVSGSHNNGPYEIEIEFMVAAAPGSAGVAVPDVVGDLQAAAVTAITAVGLTVGTITLTVTTGTPDGTVLSQSPTAGTLVALGSAVDLEVAVAPGLVVRIDGIPQRILHESLSIQATVNGRDRLSATLPLPTVAPEVRQAILVTYDGVRIFAGFLDTAVMRAGSSWTDRDDQLLFDITAADYNVLADWRLVNGPRPEETIKAYLTDLVLFLAGVTLHPAQVDGPLLPSRGQTFQTISQVLDEVTTITGYVWNIDYDGRLKMWLPSVEAAPFDILDSNAYALGDITVEPSTTGYANMVWVLAGDSGQHDISSTFTGDGTTLEWDLPHGLVTHGGTLTHAGVPENVGPGEAWELDALPTPYAFTLRRAIGSAPAVGALIVFPYTAQYPLVFRAQDYDVIAEVGFIVEQVFTEPTVFDPAQAQALVDGYLAQLIQDVREVRYTTLRGDILPGQTQTITIATRGLSGSFVITDVETRMQDPLLVRHVTARNPGPYAGNWRDVYKLWAQGQTGSAAAYAATPDAPSSVTPTPAGPHHASHEPGGSDALTSYLPTADVDLVIRTGTRVAQPAATAVIPGTLYCVTDERNMVERSTGTVWEAFVRRRHVAIFAYDYSTTLTAPPASTTVRFDAAGPYTAVTKVWVHVQTNDGRDVYLGLMGTDIGARVTIQDKNDHTYFATFTVTGTPVDHTTYIEWPVAYYSNGGASLFNNQAVLVMKQ